MQSPVIELNTRRAVHDARHGKREAAFWNQHDAAVYFAVSDATVLAWRTKVKKGDRIPWYEGPTGGVRIPIAEAIRWHERWRMQ